MNDKKLIEFNHRHGINVLNTTGRAYRRDLNNYAQFQDPYDYNNMVPQTFHTVIEKLYTVTIPESSLERLVNVDEEVFKRQGAGQSHYDLFVKMLDQKRAEQNLRESIPAVKKAYEQYSLILALSQKTNNS